MGQSYDYIVVGAGTAGCIMAARLSEDPGVNVLLVEAGGSDRGLFITMPGALPFVYQNTKINWGHRSGRAGAAPQRQDHRREGRQGDRRIVLDQRDDLQPRQPDGL